MLPHKSCGSTKHSYAEYNNEVTHCCNTKPTGLNELLRAGDSCWKGMYGTFNNTEQIKLNTTVIYVPNHPAIGFDPKKDQYLDLASKL